MSFLTLSLVISVSAIGMSKPVSRVGRRLPMTLGPLLGAGGVFWQPHLSASSGYADILGPMLMMAFGKGMTLRTPDPPRCPASPGT